MHSNDDFRKNDLNNLKEKAEKDIFEVIGAKDISEEEKGALMVSMLELINSRSLEKALDAMNPEQQERLNSIIDDDNPEAFESFLLEAVPNYPQIIEDEAKKLRQELIIDLGK